MSSSTDTVAGVSPLLGRWFIRLTSVLPYREVDAAASRRASLPAQACAARADEAGLHSPAQLVDRREARSIRARVRVRGHLATGRAAFALSRARRARQRRRAE